MRRRHGGGVRRGKGDKREQAVNNRSDAIVSLSCRYCLAVVSLIPTPRQGDMDKEKETGKARTEQASGCNMRGTVPRGTTRGGRRRRGSDQLSSARSRVLT